MLLLSQGPHIHPLLQLLHDVGYSRSFCLLHHADIICNGESPVLQQQLQRLLLQQLQQTVDAPPQETRSDLLLALLQQRKYAEARQWAKLAGELPTPRSRQQNCKQLSMQKQQRQQQLLLHH